MNKRANLLNYIFDGTHLHDPINVAISVLDSGKTKRQRSQTVHSSSQVFTNIVYNN